ncbi:MAG: glycosyltransferase, partial [Acidimicrobiales bacterium]
MTEFGPGDLAVVIPTRDRLAVLERTLEALRSQTVSGFETVVVADGTDQQLPDLGDARIVVQEHSGPGAARNTGVKSTGRPLVLFLGDDMIPDPGLVRTHLARHNLRPSPEHAVLGNVEWHPEVPRNRVVRWLEFSATQFDFENIAGEDAGWGRFYSCNVSLKRDFFQSVGGFDEDFAFDYEDLDLGFRLNEKGMVLWYERGATARHLHGYDFESLARRYESRAGAERLMMKKHPWFSPYFADKVQTARESPTASAGWVLLAGSRHSRLLSRRVREVARARTDTWFHQKLGPRFLAAWDAYDDLSELKAYLGDSFDIELLWNHRRAVDDEELRAGDEAAFYRSSEMYLYDLTAFAMTGIKRPYLAALQKLVPPGATVLDFGCGIGSDGLRLLDRGFRMAFADFDNPSTRFLRWRLERRASDAPVFDLDGDVPGG